MRRRGVGPYYLFTGTIYLARDAVVVNMATVIAPFNRGYAIGNNRAIFSSCREQLALSFSLLLYLLAWPPLHRKKDICLFLF